MLMPIYALSVHIAYFVRLYGNVLSLWLVEYLSGCQTTQDFLQQQTLLLAELLQYTLVLDGTTRQIWQHFVNRTVRDVLVG